MAFSLEASFDSVRGHEIAHQGLRLASILLPLGAYIGPLQMALRIGNFVVPCLGKYLGAFDSKQLTTELGDRFVGEVLSAFGPKWLVAFGSLHSLLEAGHRKSLLDRAFSATLFALYGSKLLFPRCSAHSAAVVVLGLRSFLRSYQSYQKNEKWSAAAHLLVGTTRVGAFGMEFLTEKKNEASFKGATLKSTTPQTNRVGLRKFAANSKDLSLAVTVGGTTSPQILPSTPPNTGGTISCGWRNEENSDRIDELRKSAKEHFENEKQYAYDCVDDLFHANFGSAVKDIEEGLKEYAAGMRDRFEATELEYMPDNYQDIRSGKR